MHALQLVGDGKLSRLFSLITDATFRLDQIPQLRSVNEIEDAVEREAAAVANANALRANPYVWAPTPGDAVPNRNWRNGVRLTVVCCESINGWPTVVECIDDGGVKVPARTRNNLGLVQWHPSVQPAEGPAWPIAKIAAPIKTVTVEFRPGTWYVPASGDLACNTPEGLAVEARERLLRCASDMMTRELFTGHYTRSPAIRDYAMNLASGYLEIDDALAGMDAWRIKNKAGRGVSHVPGHGVYKLRKCNGLVELEGGPSDAAGHWLNLDGGVGVDFNGDPVVPAAECLTAGCPPEATPQAIPPPAAGVANGYTWATGPILAAVSDPVMVNRANLVSPAASIELLDNMVDAVWEIHTLGVWNPCFAAAAPTILGGCPLPAVEGDKQ